MTSADDTPTSGAGDVDAIAEALAQLRGRGRGPGGRPPFGPGGPGSPFGPGPLGRGGRGRAGLGTHRPVPEEFGDFGRHPQGAPARLRLLEALAAADGPQPVSALGDAIGVDQPRASRLIQQAEQLGLVERAPDPDDARRMLTSLTEHGAKILAGYRSRRRTALADALEGFTPQERAELARLLGKLADAWPEPPRRHRDH